MPWVARDIGGDHIIPEEVRDGETVYCIQCGGEMSPRGPTIDGKARHFVHHGGSSSCGRGSAGESHLHQKWKSMVHSALRQWFGSQIKSLNPEVHLDVSNTSSDSVARRVDVLLEFETSHQILGEGLAVEVQHENHNKEKEPVTHDYLVNGYSVYWADSEDFLADRFQVHRLVKSFHRSMEHNEMKAIKQPNAPISGYPPIKASKPDAVAPDGETFHTTAGEDGVNEPVFELPRLTEIDCSGHPIPNLPDCNHKYSIDDMRGEKRAECQRCGLVLRASYIETEQTKSESSTSVSGSGRKPPTQRKSAFLVDGAANTGFGGLPDSNEPDEPPFCGDRLWKVDPEADKYYCVTCGKVYPRSNDSLISKYNSDKV